MEKILIKGAKIVNEGAVRQADLLIEGPFISRIDKSISGEGSRVIDAEGKYIFPGVIDDQVHFREPGMTHKAEIATESRAAVAGGITSFMEMPNTIPHAITGEILEEKYRIASQRSLANYSFYIGATNDNLEEIKKTDPDQVCGVKIFMGSSTGNMLVDDETALRSIFSQSPVLIATHCEDEATIRRNLQVFRKKYGERIPVKMHPMIRSEEACYLSSSLAVELAREYNSRLHILHISTARELDLFTGQVPLSDKNITAEVCIHHLWFSDEDYGRLGANIKWNPAIKTASDRHALRAALVDGRLDVVATDHAPHTADEKKQTYFQAPSGGPLVQHALVAMLELYHQGIFDLELIVQKMAHNPALMFHIDRRGFLREGFYADLVLVDLKDPWRVSKQNILAKCGWSPFEGELFSARIDKTFVNGNLVFDSGSVLEGKNGMRLQFDRI